MSDEISLGDRVHFVSGPHKGEEGEVMALLISAHSDDRRVILVRTDSGRRLAAIAGEVQRIARLIH